MVVRMRKKTMALLLVLSSMLAATGCGTSAAGETGAAGADVQEAKEQLEEEFQEEGSGSEQESELEKDSEAQESNDAKNKETSGDKPKAAVPGELSDDLYDFQISIDGTVYQFPMWYSDFEALGWEYDGDASQTLSSNQYTAAETWVKDGYKIYRKFANLSMNTVPFSESMVAGITLEDFYLQDCDWEIILPGGIQYGVSDTDAIKAAYGEPTGDYDGDLYYKMTYDKDHYREVNLYVYKDDNTLKEIDIENLVELEGADNSIDETVPELVKAYEAPKELTDDFYTYTAQLEGVVYSLPCPVSVLMENGFTIDKESSDSEVAAGGNGWIDLCCNNQTLHVMVENYADYATIIENCFVLSMKSSEFDPKFDLVFPGGIKIGDSEDKVKEAADGFNCEVENSESGFTYYEISDPDAGVLDSYSIVLKDGKVCSLEVQNSQRPK